MIERYDVSKVLDGKSKLSQAMYISNGEMAQWSKQGSTAIARRIRSAHLHGIQEVQESQEAESCRSWKHAQDCWSKTQCTASC